jgi:hypothetical protein
MIWIILFIVILIIFVISSFLFVNWGTHLQMVSDKNTEKITFNAFLKMYNQVEFRRDYRFPESLFNHNYDCSLHADMIKFNRKYYTLGAFDFFRYLIWKKNEIRFYEIEDTFFI